jgi:hypothetical protein
VGGHAYCNNGAGVPSVATFDLGKANQNVILHRNGDNSFSGPVARYTDDNNYLYLMLFYGGANYLRLYEKVASVDAQIGSTIDIGVGANDLRLDVSGANVNVYKNGSGTPIITGTTNLVTGNKVGIRTDQILARVKSITAY